MQEFLNNLKQSHLLAEDEWRAVDRAVEEESDRRRAVNPHGTLEPARVARRLVERGLLTRWQADRLLDGQRAFFLGRYRLLDQIGSGGMGAVFKARQESLGRIVALKVMSSTLVRDPDAVARFRQEMQAAAALHDPHIVAAYDAESVGDTHFLVMEYVEGHDLGYLLKRDGRLEIAWACECIRQAALGLQHAYEQGLVHRDLKPTNLLVVEDSASHRPLIKMLDMGLARLVSEAGDDAGLTQTGQVLGTPDYIAPEQAADTRQADIRSDIFSLGCTLFRLLTGNVPFPGKTVMEKLMSRALHDAASVRTQRPEVSAELDAVLAKMLAREPRDRYQTPGEVATALSPFAKDYIWRTGGVSPSSVSGFQGTAVLRSPEETTNDFTEFADDSRLNDFLRLLSTAAEPDADAPTVVASFRAGRVSDGPVLVEKPVARGPEKAESRNRKRRWRAVGFLAVVSVVAATWWGTLRGTELVIQWPLTERTGATLEVDGDVYVVAPDEPFVFRGPPGDRTIRATRVGFESIEKTFTLRRGDRIVWKPEWKLSASSLRKEELARLKRQVERFTTAAVADSAAVNMRERLAAFVHHHEGTPESLDAAKQMPLLVWPLDMLSRTQISPAHLRAAGFGDEHNAPRELVALLGDSTLRHWNDVTELAASPDGTLIAAASSDGTVVLWETATGAARHTLLIGDRNVSVTFNPTGDLLATIGDQRGVVFWDVATGKLLRQLPDARWPAAFSPDGKLLAAQGRRRGIVIASVSNGSTRQTLAGHANKTLRSLAFHPDGGYLLSSGSDGVARLWSVTTGELHREFSPAAKPQFNSAGTLLAAGTAMNTVTLWKGVTSEVHRTLDEAGEPLAFLPRVTSARYEYRTVPSGPSGSLATLRNGRVIVWNVATGEEQGTLRDVTGRIALDRTGQFIATGDEDFGWLQFMDVSTGATRSAPGHARGITDLTFALWQPPPAGKDPGEHYLTAGVGLISGSADHSIKLWDPPTAREQPRGDGGLVAADLSPDGSMLALAGTDGSVRLWDVLSRRASRTLEENAKLIHSLQFSPNGQWLACIGDWGFFTVTVRLWDASTGREQTLVGDVPGNVRSLAFSPNSQLLATAGDGRSIVLWDLNTRKVKQTLDDLPDRATAIAFNPQGTLLAAACRNKSVQLWSFALERDSGWQPLSTAQGAETGPVSTIAFSPEGSYLATASADRVQLWIVNRARWTQKLVAPGGAINSLQFSLDGSRLAAANSAGKVHLWTLPHAGMGDLEPERTFTLGPLGGIIARAFFDTTGRHLLTLNGNGTLYVLRLDQHQEINRPNTETTSSEK